MLCDLTGTVVAERRAPLNLGAGADAVVEGAAREVEALLAGASEGRRAVPVDAAPDPYGSSLLPVLGVGVALPGPLDHLHGVLHRVTGFPEWDGFPLRAALARRLGMPVVVDKDTNAAALGLAAVAGAHGSFAYLHLGTGLGAGLVIDGAVHRGPGPAPGSSGIRSSSWTGRCASAGTGGA